VGGPSRIFLFLALAAAAVVTGIAGVQGRWAVLAVGALATVYFAARLFLGLGRRP
jgi:hypothetical protein